MPEIRKTSIASAARAAAFDALTEFFQESPPPLDDVLYDRIRRGNLSGADRGLCFHIAQGVVRHRDFLVGFLSRFFREKLRMPPEPVLIALRIGAFQHLFLDRIPSHAVVHSTVELVREAGVGDAFGGFVNAVMRRVVASDREEVLRLPAESPRKQILLRYSIPAWIGREIEAAYGVDRLRAECEAMAQAAPTDLRVNTLKTNRPAMQERLAQELAALTRSEEGSPRAIVGPYSPDGLRLSEGMDVTRLPAYGEGLVTLQDEAAQLVSHFVGVGRGMRVADFCAAPGGKATHLAALSEDSAEVWALDIDPFRLGRVEEACARLGCSSVRVAMNTEETRRVWHREGNGLDAALVDPPCTNLGTVRRHPDVKWRHRASDPMSMAEKQLSILTEAAGCVRLGGVLVYSVCTFTRAETVGVIERFLDRNPGWRRDGDYVQPSFVPKVWRTESGDWLSSTSRDGLDGFFVSRLRRVD